MLDAWESEDLPIHNGKHSARGGVPPMKDRDTTIVFFVSDQLTSRCFLEWMDRKRF